MKKKWLIGTGALILFLCIIGISYALWVYQLVQPTSNDILSSSFAITFQEENAIQLQSAYPIYDADGMKLTPYTFTITNQCDAYASYQVNLEVLNTSTLSHYDYIKVMFDEDKPALLSNYEAVTKTLDNATASYKLTTGYLDKNESVTYDLRLWIDENVTMESEGIFNTTFASKVTVVSSYADHIPSDYELCVSKYGEDSPQCNILASLDTTGSCPAVNEDGSISVTTKEDTKALVCSAPDDYGTSYYYRGAPTNNYVKFGGFYWRILRVNGDGSIRMIYDGDASVIDALDESTRQTVLANGYDDETTKYTYIGTSKYNSNYGNNAYVGYMYGDNIWGEEVKSDTTTSIEMNNTKYYYATTYTFNTSTGRYTLGEDATVGPWSSSFVGYYTCKSTSKTGTCSTMYKIESFVDNAYGSAYIYRNSGSSGAYTEKHEATLSNQAFGTRYYYGTGYELYEYSGGFQLTGASQETWDESKVGYYTCASTSLSCDTLYYVESYDDAVNGTVSSYTSWTGTTYEETHANIKDSTIKTKVDEWYKNNILNTEYEQYISDTLFCNDRSFYSSNTGTGVGKSVTYYRANSGDVKTLLTSGQF